MRLGPPGRERPVVRDEHGTIFDLSGLTGDIDGPFLAADGLARARRALNAGRLPVYEPACERVAAPVARPGKLVCIGPNYRKPGREIDITEPALFLKAPDTAGDIAGLGMRLWVDCQVRQDGGTKDMVFDVPFLVWYVSQFMVLEPGDVINTGTPPGCAIGLPDRPYLRAGQVVELEINGLGRQRQLIGQA